MQFCVMSYHFSNTKMLRIFGLLCFLLHFGTGVTVGSRTRMEWTRELVLDDKFTVRFNNENVDKLIMEISAPTSGYVAIGFSPNGGMKGSDIVMSWIDDSGQAHIKDLHAVGNSMPLEDDVSNYELIWAEETQFGTTVRFSRPWNTCDEKHDFEITEDTIRLIWATSQDDPRIFPDGTFQPNYHGPDFRGGRSVFLKVKTHLQKFPDDEHHPDPHIKHWDVRMNRMIIPDDSDTTYYCKIVKSPHVYDLKHQIIGFRTLIDEANKQYVHHINFFECNVPQSHGGSEEIFEKYLNHPAGHCYHKNMPPEWGQYCMTVPFVWVAGAEGLMLPEEGGIPLGEHNNGTTYFMLEIHYDNPKLLQFEDSSGVRIFVTDKPRPNDIGAVTIHTRFSHGFHLIPPGYIGFKNMALCTSECTQQAFPPEGVTVTHATLHAHLAARKMKLSLIRNGKELEPLAQDDHYDFNYQQSRLVSPSRKLYPGDTLMVECEYDTTDRRKITYGGTSTRDEMCQGYVYFYPRVQLALCKTQYNYDNFFNALGIQEVEGQEVLDRLQLPYKPQPNQMYDPGDDAYILKNNSNGPQYIFDLLEVKKPSQYRRTSVAEFVENLPWQRNDNELTKTVWRKWWDGKYDTFCTGHHFKRIPLQDYSVSYPKFVPYVKPTDQKCNGRQGRNRELGASGSTENTSSFLILSFTLLTLYTGIQVI